MYRLISTSGLVVAACLLVNCGGSGGTTAALAKAQYIRRAEAICSKINREAEAAAASWKKSFPGAAAEAEEHPNDGLRKVLIPALEREAKQLESLAPPAGDEAAVTGFVQNLSRGIRALRRRGFKAMPSSGALDFKREAAEYGLDSCGRVL